MRKPQRAIVIVGRQFRAVLERAVVAHPNISASRGAAIGSKADAAKIPESSLAEVREDPVILFGVQDVGPIKDVHVRTWIRAPLAAQDPDWAVTHGLTPGGLAGEPVETPGR